MKNKFQLFIAMVFPWLILLLDDNPGGAFVAIAMQASVIGWIPASLWAMRVVRENQAKQKRKIEHNL